MSIEEVDIKLQEDDVSEGIVLGLGQTNLNENVEDIVEDIEEINVDNKKLTYLPDLSRFTNLKKLKKTASRLQPFREFLVSET